MYTVLAIDIGGTKIAAALVDVEHGTLVHYQTISTPARLGPAAIFQAVGEVGWRVLELGRSGGCIAQAVGVGAAGLVEPASGRIVYATDNLPGWQGAAVADELQEVFKLPVAVENDVNALALGEQYYGAGRSFEHVLYVAVGTGIGGAWVLNGCLWHGASNSAGNIAHWLVDVQQQRRCSCGQAGHLEAYASGPALEQRYQELAGRPDRLSLREISQRARSGELLSQQVITEGARILGSGLVGLLCAIDPQAVVIGGGVGELGEVWWQPLGEALYSAPLPGPRQVKLSKAQLGTQAVLVGAAWLAGGRVSSVLPRSAG